MQNELDTLEQKLIQLVQLTQQLRAENLQLRQQIAATLNDNHKYKEKLDQAARRIERILEKLPEENG